MARKSSVPSDPKTLAKLLTSEISMSAGYAHDLAHGKKRPSLKLAVRFERLYGIPCSYWTDRATAAA